MTTHGQKEKLLYHNKSGRNGNMKHNLKEARSTLRIEYARRLASYEIELSEGERRIDSAELLKIQEYSMSTSLRRRFLMHTIVAHLDGNYADVSNTKKLLCTSRAAMDTMVKETGDAGWIHIKRNKQKHRSIQATEIVVECWLGYADFVTHLANKYNLNYLSNSQAKIGELLETK